MNRYIKYFLDPILLKVMLSGGMLALISTLAISQSPAPTAAPQSASTTKKVVAPNHQKSASTPVNLKTSKDRLSYAVGADMAKSLKNQAIYIDPALASRGFRDGLSSGKLALTDTQMHVSLEELHSLMRKHQMDIAQTAMQSNRDAGTVFLAANKAKSGVVTTASGLQYKVLKAGDGKKPGLNDTVVCNYRGTLINGKEFDSSYARKEPVSIPVSGVIKGWTEALQLMPVGSKWQLFLPPSLAYGEHEAGPDIGPGSALIFDVELLSITENK